MPMLERDIETQIDRQLNNLEWNDDSKDPKCTVFKQRPKTEEQKKALKGKRPDYVLYQENSNNPLIIIEAKKPHENIQKALEQGIDYAKKLKAPMVFATDGIYTKTYHLEKQKPLYLNKEEVDELIRQSQAINYINDNEYFSVDKKIIQSREELITIFKDLNDRFKESGVRSGLPRIELFTNLLFLKIIGELSETNELIKPIPNWCQWNNLKQKKGEELLHFINGQAFEHFKSAYDGEVLSPIQGLLKPSILDTVITKLDDLHLSATNTDIKGEAFEFFLRNYGGADTDFGEYFTPRHIVKAMVKLLNPQFGEKVYDPFCGTGGMLITSYKHIYERMPRNEKTINELKNDTMYGGEFTEMFRIAKMNMILAGDGHSNINRQDSYETPQRGKYDVVITNIPFGSKMKTQYGSLYGYSTQSAEVTGVLHCLDALSDKNENARAGIIVPEGILFNGNKAYTQLRKQLVEKHEIETIVSLPKETFLPNTGVKSNILIVKKKPSKSEHIWYFNVKNDGYSLDTVRRKIEGSNDIDTILSEKELNINEKDLLKKVGFSALDKSKITNNEYVLLANQYEKQVLNTKHPLIRLKELEDKKILSFLKGQGISKKQLSVNGEYPCIHYGELYTLYHSPIISTVINKTNILGKILSTKNDILIPATTTADADGIAIARAINKDNIILGGDINIIRIHDTDILKPSYLSYIFNYVLKSFLAKYARGANILHLNNKDIKKIKIPLPTIEEQERIIKEMNDIETTIINARKEFEKLEKRMNDKASSLFD